MPCFIYLFQRKKFFGIVLFLTLSYYTADRLYQAPIVVQSAISTSLTNISQTSIISLSTASFYDEVQNEFFENKCIDNSNQRRRSLLDIIRFDDILNYVGFVVRSHSLFYCSVPKVATRTLLTFLTYLHIRDDLIPLIKNLSTAHEDLISISNIDYLNQLILSLVKDTSERSPSSNSLFVLRSFLSHLMVNNNTNSSKIDIWSLYQNKVFPYIRLRSLSNPSILFSLNYTRVIFVRHPLERLASAYSDKICSLKNEPFSLYDSLRRTICRKYSLFYLTKGQRISYRTRKGSSKRIDEPCQNVIPTFEHFIEYLMSDSLQDDVHWQPYSKLCHVCLFKYNFIGKYETMNEDLNRLIELVGLKSKDWISENYFKSGKTKENYKLMYSNLPNHLICDLKDFYKDDLRLFNYQLEDYFLNQTNIQCDSKRKKYFKKKFRRN